MTMVMSENTAGALMTPEFVRLRAGTSAGEALRAVRQSGLDSDAMYTLYVVDGQGRLMGALELCTLLASPEDAPVEALMDADCHAVRTDDDQQRAAMLVRRYDLIGLPVLDENGVLAGAIGVNSIVNVIEEEDTEDFERMAALMPGEGGYKAASPWKLAGRRLPWLMALMFSSVLCARLIQGYGGLLMSSGALGVLVASNMPMLMDTGGNCGAQSSTAVVRALALGELPPRQTGRALWREVRAGLLCGLLLALVNLARLVLISRVPLPAALAISAAVMATVATADALGCLLPLLAERMGLDPAVMAGPLITTLVDLCALSILFAFAALVV